MTSEHTIEMRFREIAQRIEVCRFHPDKAIKRQAQGIVSTGDAPDLLVACAALVGRVRELESQLMGVISDTHDGMTFWLAMLEMSDGEVQFDKAWFDAFTPSGGWDVEITEDKLIVRARTDKEIADLRKEAADGPGPE